MFKLLSHVLRLILVLMFMICWGTTASAIDPFNQPVPYNKSNHHISQNPGTPDGREGGEDIATALIIADLPFEDTGNTTDNKDNYDEVCPYSGSTSPDVVYAYTPTAEVLVCIDLCGSYYDTKVYVYENTYTPGNPYACNDDWYVSAYDPCGQYVSKIPELLLTAGNTYYIVVDGYLGDSGSYSIDVHETQPCVVAYPGEPYVDEGEPDLYAGYVDNLNGGCTSVPPVYQFIDWIDETGCAHLWANSGWYFSDPEYRWDVDVFIVTAEGGSMSFTVETEYYSAWMLVYDVFDCENLNIMLAESIQPCQPTTISWTADAETEFALAVLPVNTLPMTFTYHYTMEVCGHEYDVVSTETTTWGNLKSMYR